jgi:PBSX family phage terminase large subunit
MARGGLAGARERTQLHAEGRNGNRIVFAGLDDVEKLKSINGITGIWIEEASEVENEDVDQLNLRLRGKMPYYKQIILSFNPISMGNFLRAKFFTDPPRSDCRYITALTMTIDSSTPSMRPS